MLTRIVSLLIVLLVCLSSARATDERAVEAYRRGDLATARTEWLAILDDPATSPRGFERARILYDLGNTAFREGKTLEAVGWYTASLRLRPRDADTWTNLEEARSRAKLEPADRGDLSSTTTRLVRSFTPAEARWLALYGFVVLAGALVFEALRGGRAARWLAWAVAGCVCLALVPCVDQHLRSDDRPMLVIQPDGGALKSEPREQAARSADLAAGLIVEYVDELPDWTKVRLETGLEGWVEANAVFDLVR